MSPTLNLPRADPEFWSILDHHRRAKGASFSHMSRGLREVGVEVCGRTIDVDPSTLAKMFRGEIDLQGLTMVEAMARCLDVPDDDRQRLYALSGQVPLGFQLQSADSPAAILGGTASGRVLRTALQGSRVMVEGDGFLRAMSDGAWNALPGLVAAAAGRPDDVDVRSKVQEALAPIRAVLDGWDNVHPDPTQEAAMIRLLGNEARRRIDRIVGPENMIAAASVDAPEKGGV